jgi:hypothetical protein
VRDPSLSRALEQPRVDPRELETGEVPRFHLLYELASGLSASSGANAELCDYFLRSSIGEPAAHEHRDRVVQALAATLDLEIRSGLLEVTLEPYWTDSLREREAIEGEAPPLRALPPPEKEVSFIAANLLDQDGKPVIGRRWTIELPDGSRHAGVTDDDGWARVKGFTQDGSAKITFPDFDELDMATRNSAKRVIIPVLGELPPGGEEPAPIAADASAAEEPLLPGLTFLDVEIVGPSGKPLAGRKYKLELPDGQTEEGVLGSDGRLRKRNIAPGKARVSLLPESGDLLEGAVVPEQPANVETTTYTVRVVSALGTPLVGLEMAFSFGSRTAIATTNEQGVAEIEGPSGTPPLVRIADPSQLSTLVQSL